MSPRSGPAASAVADSLRSIEAANPKLNAFIEVFADQAAHGRTAESRTVAPGPLAGVPVALKDNICLSHGRTTCGSRILESYHSPFTATAAQRLIDAGAIIVGKTNCDEFAMGSSTEHSAFGPTRNPWDLSRVPGGSSGGSAAAVAAGLVPIALGSDTGGSIRQPAGFCGLVGIKPTYGRVSRWGLVAYASSLDQIGPLARTVPDAALALQVIWGHDPNDSTSSSRPAPDLVADLDSPVGGLVIGVPRQAESGANHDAVRSAMSEAADRFRDAGAEIRPVDLPHADHAIAAYYIVACAEASSNLARFDGVRYGRRAALTPAASLDDLYMMSRSEGFGPEVQRRIMLGTYVLSAGYYDAYYTTALKARRLIKSDYDAAFASGCHALLMPTSPGPAFRLGEKTDDPLALYLEDVYTVGVNLAGLPAIAFPGGLTISDGSRLPVGLQLIGPAWDEARLLRIARMHEHAVGFNLRPPAIG